MSPIKRPRFGGVFLFALLQYSRTQAFTVRFVPSMQSYTAHAAKHRTELYRRLSGYLLHFAAVVWRVHPAILHRLRHAGRCTAQHSRPIIIMYIRVHGCAPVMDPCQTVQQIADHASPAGQSSSRDRAGGAEPLAATAVSLFGLSPDS